MTRALRIQAVADMCGGVSTNTILRWADDPKVGFPKPFTIGGGTVVWDENEVAAYLKQQKENHHGSGNQTQEAAQ